MESVKYSNVKVGVYFETDQIERLFIIEYLFIRKAYEATVK